MNIGVYPIDPTTEVGKLRLLVGDTNAVEIPSQPGFADYGQWSDDALATVLAAQGGNQLRAAGTLYLQLAAEYALQGRSVRTDDLAIDTKGRGNDLRLIAQNFFDRADDEDATAAGDFFQLVPFGGRIGRERRVRPEGTPWPSGC